MSSENKVNPSQYTQRGRLTPDDAAREMAKQRQPLTGSDAKGHPKSHSEAWHVPGREGARDYRHAHPLGLAPRGATESSPGSARSAPAWAPSASSPAGRRRAIRGCNCKAGKTRCGRPRS